MKSARRQAYAARKQAHAVRKNKKEKKGFSFVKFLIPLLLVFAFYLFLKITTQLWNGKDKISLVYKETNGDVQVTVLDPLLSEITTIVIPGDTQVEVARNYGTIRIKNVWQLGVNENIDGDLLAETVTQNFLFPVFLWSEKPPGWGSGNLTEILNFIFLPGSTNISFGDRLQAGLFVLRIQEIGKSVIDLGKSRFLDKGALEDGQAGYVLTGPISQRLTIYFTDNVIGDKNIKVNITDATGSAGISEKLGEILQVIGGKVVSIEKKSISEDTDCVVTGGSVEAVKKISNLFSCKVGNSKTSFDLDIEIGKKFAERF
jgi:DNA-binding transcriptional regulator of glucitol operon